MALWGNGLIWFWLTQESSITLKRVRHSMWLWARLEQQLSQQRVKESARDLVDFVADADGKRKAEQEVRKALSSYHFSERKEYVEAMTDALSYATNVIPRTAEQVAQILYNYECVLQDLQRPEAFPDIVWYWTRHVCLRGLHLDQGDLCTPLSTACMDLALTLQLSRLPQIQPQIVAWQEQVKFTQVLHDQTGHIIHRIYLR